MGLFKKKDKVLKKKINGIKTNFPWIFWGILVCFAGSAVLSCFYGALHDNAKKWHNNLMEQTGNVSWLYQSTYLLYKDLYNVQNEAQLNYTDIYLKPKEGYEWLLDEEILSERCEGQDYGYDTDENISEMSVSPDSIGEDEASKISEEINNLKGYFSGLEGDFRTLNNIYDYIIRDNNTDKYVTNMSEEDADRILSDISTYNRYFLLTFQFDSAGNVSVGNVLSENGERLRKAANEVVRENTLSSLISTNLEYFSKYGEVGGPKDCTVIFAASADSLLGNGEVWGVHSNAYFSEAGSYNLYYSLDYMGYGNGASVEAYRGAGIDGILLLCMAVFVLLGLLLPVLGGTKPWNDNRLCSLPFEFLFILGVCIFAVVSLIERHIVFVASGTAQNALVNYLQISDNMAWCLAQIYNLFVLTLFFFGSWYIGICARAVSEKGIVGYIQERSLIYRFFPFMKSKVLGVYNAVEHLDLTKDAHKTIIKVISVNAVILLIISLLWYGGFFMTVIYSVILYLILRKYVSGLQKKYSVLLKATNEMAEGNLNVTIDEDLGVFEPFKPQIIRIQEGFKKAVDEEVKSQKMKAELITNVSHDLKTPLTAIITYVNLLKEEGITEEQRKEYLDVLERKSLRLKVLIEDLFEVSKANSQNITLNLTDVDIMSLLKQVSFEMADKLEAAGLDVRMNLTDEKILLSLDSQKTYRIYENLFGNIAKYAMRGTRVYVNGFRIDDMVVITLKNISAQEITVDSADLTERFVRGDASRNTEGSGLGLAIAKSFTELQGGELSLEVDGDLFKVTTSWHLKEE